MSKKNNNNDDYYYYNGNEVLFGVITDTFNNRFYVAFSCVVFILIVRRMRKRQLAYLETLPWLNL